MSLESKRAAAKVKSQYIPDFEQRIQEACGFPVKLDVDWESYEDRPALMEGTQSAFMTVLAALKDICKDSLGRDLAQAAITSALVANTGKGEFSADLADGVMIARFPDGGSASIGYTSRLVAAVGDKL